MLLSVDQSQNIPPELWMKIFSYLSPRQVGLISFVSQLFKAISENQLLWEVLVRRNYPDTYAQLSTRLTVQETEVGNKRRRGEIDWRVECIKRVQFFSFAKQGRLDFTLIVKGLVACFDIFEERVYVGGADKLTTTNANGKEQLVGIEVRKNAIITSIKVEKRKDGEISIYTGDMKGNIISWQFDGVKFEQKREFARASQNREKVLDLYPYRKKN